MVCHGELVRLKPGPRHLTRFYLMVAGGGAAGGLFVTVAAPYLFRDYWEYHLGLAATGLLAIMLLFRSAAPRQGFVRMLEFWGGRAILCASWAALVVTLGGQIRQTAANSLTTRRNFFGVLRVQELNKDDPGQAALSLMHGRIRHGFQFLDREKRFWPTTYYGPESGAGIAIRFHPRRLAQDVMRMGVIGLGTGTLAAYGRPGDSIRFYEINPEVLRLSDEYFTFRDCPARVEVVLGDARVSMERERERRECQRFDVLAIDAFSSDAIPVHLLTRECFEVYRYHLRKDGILAFHISNRYFDLSPVLRNLIDAGPTQDMRAIRVDSDSNASMGTDRSEWVLLTANREFLENQDVMRSVTPWNEQPPRTVWTDDYSGLFSLLRGNRNGDR
jgi:hypothetical protein